MNVVKLQAIPSSAPAALDRLSSLRTIAFAASSVIDQLDALRSNGRGQSADADRSLSEARELLQMIDQGLADAEDCLELAAERAA